MTELRVFTIVAVCDIPLSFYLCLIAVCCMGFPSMLWHYGLREGLRWCAVLLLVEWLLLVVGNTLLFREVNTDIQVNLIPMSSYFDYGKHSYLMEKVALNILNVALFVPAGFLLGCGFRGITWRKALGYGAVLSFSIELFQLICSKGLCEIDDVIHNAVGCMIGYGLYKLTALFIMNFKSYKD